MDKLIEDLLNYVCNTSIEIEEIQEEIQEKKEIYFADNPARFDMNCKCKSCKSMIEHLKQESASKDQSEVNLEVLPACRCP
jgi:NCAIR mutase (PurE)-related protein